MENNFWKKNKSLIIFGGLAIVLGLIYVGLNISYSNTANQLEVRADKKIKANKASYDAMWKIVKEQMGVADNYKESFKEIYTGIMDERYSDNKGALMSWVQEHNPSFDASMYKKVMNSIESGRNDFAARQKELISIEEEYNKMLVTFPSSHFLGDRDMMDNKIVTSSKTEAVFETGLEDELLIQ